MGTGLGAVLLCLVVIVLLAIYYTLFGVRRELIETKENLKSELSEVRKLLEKAAGKG